MVGWGGDRASVGSSAGSTALLGLVLAMLACPAALRGATASDAYLDLTASITGPDTTPPDVDFTISVEGRIAGGADPTQYWLWEDATWSYLANHRVDVTGGTQLDSSGFHLGDHVTDYTLNRPSGTYSYLFVFGDRAGGHSWYDLAVEITVVVADDGCPFPAPPPGAPDLRVAKYVLDWVSTIDATSDDVVLGDLSLLRSTGGDFEAATLECLADDTAMATLPFDERPGENLFFLVRPVNCAGAGSHDTVSGPQPRSRDPGLAAAPTACP